VTEFAPPSDGPQRLAERIALVVVVGASALFALQLHRAGHAQGDDFALYLRQARSIFDGDIAAVVADNRFSVLNSDGPFSPIAYPWGWPLILSPFVHFRGFDYGELKAVLVAVFVVWLVLLHGVVRRRIGAVPAIGVVAVIGTAPLYLQHTDQLLTEFPHLAAVAVFVWWYDRMRTRGDLLTAGTRDLIVLGALVTVAYNMRREGVVLLGVIAGMQVIDLVRTTRGPRTPRALADRFRSSWSSLYVPYLSFAVSAATFQLLLPTSLFADNGNSSQFLDDRLTEFPATLADQLGLGNHHAYGMAILGIAVVGAVLGIRRRPALDTPLLLLAVLSALAVSTHLREVERYWFQVTPWVLYFLTVAFAEAGRALFGRRVELAAVLTVVPLAALVVAHMAVLPGKVADSADFNAADRVQTGPTNPVIAPIFDAVEQNTPPTAVIAYFRARTMTLMTDRRSIQTGSTAKIVKNADYFAQRRNSTYWQPDLSVGQARTEGFEEVWSNDAWILWRVPES